MSSGGGAFAPTPPASGGTGNSPFTSQQPTSEPMARTADFQDSNGNGIDDRDEGPNTPQPQVDYSMGFGRRFQQPSFINPFMGGYGFGSGFQQPFGGFGGGFQQPQFGGFGNPFGAIMSGLGSLFGGYRAMPFGGYQSMPQPPMNQGPGNAYVQPIGGSPNPRTGVMPSNPLPDPNAPPPGMELNPDYTPPGMVGTADRPRGRFRPIQGGTIAPETPRAPPSMRELPAVGSFSPYMNMQGLGGLFGGGRGIGIAPPSQAQRYDPYSFNPQADAQRQQQQMLMDREANTTDYQRLMQRKNSASAGPYVNPLTGAVGGVNPFSQVQDAEIAKSLGWQDPNMITDMRARMPEEYEAENAARNAKAREYLNSIGYGTEGFDSSKYEVRRQPIGPSPGLGSLFNGLF